MLSTESDDEADSPASAADLLSQLQEAPASREELLVSFLQQEVQAVLRLSTAPEPTVGFFDLGMDSLMAVELRNRLNRAFAEEYVVPNTVVFGLPGHRQSRPSFGWGTWRDRQCARRSGGTWTG